MPATKTKNHGNQTTHSFLSENKLRQVLDLMFQRMDYIQAQCKNGFPLYLSGNEDHWVISPGGSWVGGFWAGCWWLRAKIRQSDLLYATAINICRRLESKTQADSINRSMIFWYGAGLGDVWFNNLYAQQQLQLTANSLADSFNPELQCFPIGAEMGGGADGHRRIAVDTLAPLIQLLSRSNIAEHHMMARQHTETLIAACSENRQGFYAGALYQEGGFTPLGAAGDWSRGQAWAMLGLSRAAALWGGDYLRQAESACEYWRRSRHWVLAANQLTKPQGHHDLSAMVIAALAMLVFAESTANAEQWRLYAKQMITSVVSSEHFIGLQNNTIMDKGSFRGCCYETSRGNLEMVETIWGNFMLMLAICMILGLVEPNDC